MKGPIHPRKFSLVIVFVVTCCAHLHAANLKVDCSRKGEDHLSKGEDHLSTINKALQRLEPTEPNTVTVSGACHENVVIRHFDRLTLIANPGASISDASNGALDVVDIFDSQRILISGFTINGGLTGILCARQSLCRFIGNTIQGSSGDGVSIALSRASFGGDIIQNNPYGRGLIVLQGSEASTYGVAIQGNGTATGSPGIRVVDGSFLFVDGAIVQGNGNAGIDISDHSTIRGNNNTITGNGGDGIRVEAGSEARFGPGNTITGNVAHGISVNDLSFAHIEDPSNKISGNSAQPDVVCNPQFSATRGVLPTSNIGGGTTNCVEP